MLMLRACARSSTTGSRWGHDHHITTGPAALTALLHAGLAATLYILMREHFPMPWLWPLDDAVWVVEAVMIFLGWAVIGAREGPLARGAAIGLIVGFVSALTLFGLFEFAVAHGMPPLSTPHAFALFYGIGLAAWAFMAAFAFGAALVSGLVAGAIGSGSGPIVTLFTVCALAVPVAATWSHAVLNLGLTDLDRCRERIGDQSSLSEPLLAPRVIVVGFRADCFGRPVRGGQDSN